MDQGLPFKGGEEAAHEDDGGTSYKVIRCANNIAQGKDVGSSRKGKTLTIMSSSSYSDDGNNTDNSGDPNMDESSNSSECTSGDNGASGGVVEADPGMSWEQEEEN